MPAFERIYVINGGSFSIQGGSNLTATGGVMIYLTGGAYVNIANGATMGTTSSPIAPLSTYRRLPGCALLPGSQLHALAEQQLRRWQQYASHGVAVFPQIASDDR